MSERMSIFDEGLAEVRADATLRALAVLDSLEPSRALDRAVLGRAREAAIGRPHCAIAQSANARRRTRAGPALRWGFPAAVAAAAVCAVVVHRTASRPGPARAPDQFVVERMHPSPNDALEMVSVSARHRGVEPRVDVAAASTYVALSGSGKSPHLLIPSFIETSVPLLSISTAPLRKRGVEERTPGAATRSSERGSRREREWTARRRSRPPELIYNVDLLDVRPGPPPPPALSGAVGLSSAGGQVRDARAEAAPANPH